MNYKVITAMLLLAVFAIGAVSATDDIAIDDNVISEDTDVDVAIDDAVVDDSDDDISVEDQSSDDSEDNTRAITYTQYTVTPSNFAQVNQDISLGLYSGYQFNFQGNETYNNFAMVTGDNNKFVGNGATLNGVSNNLFTISSSSNIIITGFNMNVANNKAAIYGFNVKNIEITNNNITGGKDGINIFQTYENVTITGNKISGFGRDGISLVNHKNFTTSEWNSWTSSVVSNNIITGGNYSMFFGGNFKGTISSNTISNSKCGMQFVGKKNKTNGRLSATISGNAITGVTTGIDMSHPCVTYLNIFGNSITTSNPSSNYAIISNSFFKKSSDAILVILNQLSGKISRLFYGNVTYFLLNTGYTID